ncbi:unnamed protein product [Calicophoron daubneyi]|uniref:Uncharacterized protein n=1 Tax=Calicophoron daubneyi TaxID=300641 RepID=A0AAV2T3D7_CALDB
MVKLWVLDGSRRTNNDPSEAPSECPTQEKGVNTELFGVSEAGVQADLPPSNRSIAVQTPPKTLELGSRKQVTAVACTVCKRREQWDFAVNPRGRPLVTTRMDNRQMLIFLARIRLIRNRMCCKKCPRYPFMYLTANPDLQDAFEWVCRFCSSKKPVRHGSKLLASKLRFREIIEGIRLWSQKKNEKSSKFTLPGSYSKRLRNICILENRQAIPSSARIHWRPPKTIGNRITVGSKSRRSLIFKPSLSKPRISTGEKKLNEEQKWRESHPKNPFSSLLYACAIYQNKNI